jgi:hypothetical protein
MKSFLCISLSELLVMGVAATAHGQSLGDYRTRQSGNWQSLSTWEKFNGVTWVNQDPSGALPGLNRFVEIRHDVTILDSGSNGDALADHVDVDSGVAITFNSGGVLRMDGSSASTSTFGSNARFDLPASGAAYLRLEDNDHTFSGGLSINGVSNGSVFDTDPSGSATLTIESGVLIEGSMQLKSNLVNNGVVRASRNTGASDSTLELYSGTYTGSGTWEAKTTPGAILRFESGVTATGLTGPFDIQDGAFLEIGADVYTTGTMTFQDTGTKIFVDPGVEFAVNQ